MLSLAQRMLARRELFLGVGLVSHYVLGLDVPGRVLCGHLGMLS